MVLAVRKSESDSIICFSQTQHIAILFIRLYVLFCFETWPQSIYNATTTERVRKVMTPKQNINKSDELAKSYKVLKILHSIPCTLINIVIVHSFLMLYACTCKSKVK